MKQCKHCGKPIVLVPSAKERSEKYGHPASYFTNLFEYHSECQLERRKQMTDELINRQSR